MHVDKTTMHVTCDTVTSRDMCYGGGLPNKYNVPS